MVKKLFISTLVIVLITLGLSVFSVNLVFRQQFGNYLTQTTEAALEQLPEQLAAAYMNGRWDDNVLANVANTLPTGTEVTLKGTDGSIIATLTHPSDEMHSFGTFGGQGMTMGNMMGMNAPYTAQGWKTQTIEVKKVNETLAVATVRYPTTARMLNPQDISFSSSIFHSLLMASGLALVLGVILSYFISRHLAKPLRRLTQAADRIGQGYLEERVAALSKDELGELATAFNAMADNLKRHEELRKQFTADIAHELRTPLTSIRSFIEAFQDGVLPANTENLSAINEEIDRLVFLASDLKDLNIAEMGALQVNHMPVNLVGLIDKVVHNVSPLLQQKNLSLSWEPEVRDIEVAGDERLLTRLFYNLVHNAYKYTEPSGRIAINIETRGEEAFVTVADTGIGIAPVELPYVFERFFRTDKSRARETGGSGIGLALVQQIARLHRGEVSVESTLGQGTKFAVRLPLEVKKM